jgi:peptidylprolyl isomerase
MNRLRLLLPLAALGLACAPAQRFPSPIPPVATKARVMAALKAIDIAAGSGAAAEHHRCVYAHYTGWLTDGTKFDSSRDTTERGTPREPIAVPLGFRRVIAGWDAGFEGMQVGGKRRLIIPYQFAYGEKGRPPVIPPRATLVFDVELMAVADTLPRAAGTTWPRCPSWADVR